MHIQYDCLWWKQFLARWHYHHCVFFFASRNSTKSSQSPDSIVLLTKTSAFNTKTRSTNWTLPSTRVSSRNWTCTTRDWSACSVRNAFSSKAFSQLRRNLRKTVPKMEARTMARMMNKTVMTRLPNFVRSCSAAKRYVVICSYRCVQDLVWPTTSMFIRENWLLEHRAGRSVSSEERRGGVNVWWEVRMKNGSFCELRCVCVLQDTKSDVDNVVTDDFTKLINQLYVLCICAVGCFDLFVLFCHKTMNAALLWLTHVHIDTPAMCTGILRDCFYSLFYLPLARLENIYYSAMLFTVRGWPLWCASWLISTSFAVLWKVSKVTNPSWVWSHYNHFRAISSICAIANSCDIF